MTKWFDERVGAVNDRTWPKADIETEALPTLPAAGIVAPGRLKIPSGGAAGCSLVQADATVAAICRDDIQPASTATSSGVMRNPDFVRRQITSSALCAYSQSIK